MHNRRRAQKDAKLLNRPAGKQGLPRVRKRRPGQKQTPQLVRHSGEMRDHARMGRTSVTRRRVKPDETRKLARTVRTRKTARLKLVRTGEVRRTALEKLVRICETQRLVPLKLGLLGPAKRQT